MATRRGFDPTRDPNAIDKAPAGTVTQGTCFANGCVMPGTMRVDGGPWTCPWHYGTSPSDLPRVTQIIKDWECVSYEIRVGRRAVTGPYAADPKELSKLHDEAAARLKDATAAGGWGDQFDRLRGEDYRQWLNRLDHFLGKRIAQTLGGARS